MPPRAPAAPPGPGPSGYSGTPLVKKLGIREGARLRLVEAPPHYLDLLGPLPPGVEVLQGPTRDVDVTHLFATSRAELADRLAQARRDMAEDGMVWASWPKKAARVATDLDEIAVREMALAAGLVDVKVCAVDATWSGLKLVIRLKDRKTKARSGARRD